MSDHRGPDADGSVDRGPIVAFGQRVADLAARHPGRPAVIAAARDGRERRLSWAQLDAAANRAAWVLDAHGVASDSTVVVALPNGLHHFVATIAAWKLGALVVVLDDSTPPSERAAVERLVRPTAVVATTAGTLAPAALTDADVPPDPPPAPTALPRSATVTGGTSGAPKVVLRRQPWAFDPSRLPTPGDARWGFRCGQVQLVVHPIWHGGFSGAYNGLFLDHTLVVVERFFPRQALQLVERHRVNLVKLVPTMMRWIAQLPDVERYDLSSLEAVLHGTAPCPPETKRAWIDLVGAERVLEGYGNQEQIGATMIRGDEWLARPGSVGRPTNCEIRIRDREGRAVEPGTIGTIWMRRRDGARNDYAGAERLRVDGDGFATVDDLGWLDGDGYLYLAGRSDDMIIVGGANVQPAEVERVLAAHPAVADAAAVGVPDDGLGERVHAVVQPRDPGSAPTVEELRAWCRERLAPHKAPRSYDFVQELPRTAIGKLARTRLRRP